MIVPVFLNNECSSSPTAPTYLAEREFVVLAVDVVPLAAGVQLDALLLASCIVRFPSIPVSRKEEKRKHACAIAFEMQSEICSRP